MQNENIYVDLLLTNAIQSEPNQRVACKFFLNNSQAIIKDTTDFNLSVIRFSLNTETLPIFIPKMKNDSETVYSVTMEYNGFIFERFMQFTPQNTNPLSPDEKYYVYSYQYVMYLMNNMFNECLVGLNNLVDTSCNVAPKMIFDVNSQICQLKIDNEKYGFNETGKINIYMNSQMYGLVSSLPSSIVHLNNGRDYQINNQISDDPDLLSQEYTSVQLWNPVAKIVFTSNVLPIYETVTSPVQVYEDGHLSNNNSSYHFMNIMTDFLADSLSFVPFVQYAPSIYRMLNLKPKSSVRNIDLNVYWMNRHTGVLQPLYLVPGGSCSCKLLFSKN